MTHDRRSQARRRLRHSDSYREAVGSVSINKARVAPSSASVLTTVMTNEKLAKIPQAAVVWGNNPHLGDQPRSERTWSISPKITISVSMMRRGVLPRRSECRIIRR